MKHSRPVRQRMLPISCPARNPASNHPSTPSRGQTASAAARPTWAPGAADPAPPPAQTFLASICRSAGRAMGRVQLMAGVCKQTHLTLPVAQGLSHAIQGCMPSRAAAPYLALDAASKAELHPLLQVVELHVLQGRGNRRMRDGKSCTLLSFAAGEMTQGQAAKQGPAPPHQPGRAVPSGPSASCCRGAQRAPSLMAASSAPCFLVQLTAGRSSLSSS